MLILNLSITTIMSPTDKTGDDLDFEDENNPPPLSPNRRYVLTGLRDISFQFTRFFMITRMLYSNLQRLAAQASIALL